VTIQLWDFQEAAREDLRSAYAAGYLAPLLVLPTGAGKTTLFCDMALRASGKGKRVLILVHRCELLMQASRRLEAMGVAHGLIAPGISWRPDRVQVASKETLLRRMKKAGDPARAWLLGLDLLVIDEAHHCTPANGWGRLLGFLGLLPGEETAPMAEGHRVRCLGVTATPERLDGQGLGQACGGPFDHMVVGPSTAELVMRGYLARPVVLTADVEALTEGVEVRGGDYVAGQVAERLTRAVVGDAVAEYRKHVRGGPALVFCPTVAKAEEVAETFRAAGIRAASVDGALAHGEREARIRDLGAGVLQVLTNCMIVSEGTDIPIVEAVIMLRPTQSQALYMQMCGRGMRMYPGKSRALIIDHVGNRYRHGLPDEDREWTLDAARRKVRKKGEKERVRHEWQCERCGAWHRPVPVCPSCGFRYPVSDSMRFVDGELRAAETEAEQYARYAAAGGGLRVRSLDQWVAEARQRGYRDGWARHRFEWQEKKLAQLQGGTA
jgi:superfamily II DNA or RNA helicase